MENELIVIIIIGIFIVSYFLLYLFFTKKHKKQEALIAALLQDKESLSKKNEDKKEDKETLSALDESKNSKSILVYEQTKKLEFLESEVLRQKKRISDLKHIAQNANMAQEDFLSNITQEIKLPVESILYDYSELKLKIKDEKSTLLLENIKKSSQRLLVILNDIIDLSKLQAKTFDIVEDVVDINFLISSIFEKKKKIAKEKSLDFTLKVDEKLPNYLMLDASKVEDILENLIDNAIKYTKDGSVKINVLVDTLNTALNSVNFSFYVEDTGAGIAQEFQNKVFGAFVKVENSDEKTSQTVGLGLSIDKKIAQLMHGNITFKSDGSKGSVFRFSLSNVEIPLWSKDEVDGDESVDFSLMRENTKVLLISEDNDDYETIKDAFSKSKVTLFFYSTLREAFQTLKNEEIDLVFVDVEILNNDDGAGSKVIARISNASVVPLVTTRVKELELANTPLKPSGFLKKPLSQSELFKISLRVLNT